MILKNFNFKGKTLKIGLLFTSTWLLAACFGSPPKEEFFYFVKTPNAQIKTGNGPRISVAEFTASGGYDSPRLAYRTADNELQYYAYRKWLSSPSQMLTEAVTLYLRSSGFFKDVDQGHRVRDPDLIIASNIDAIEEIDIENRWKARLAMTFRVWDPRSEKIVLKYSFDTLRHCIKRHPTEIALRIGEVLEQEVKKLAARLVKYR